MILGELPSETQIFQALLGELHDDLPGRLARLKFLTALDNDFGGSGVMLPGGHPTYIAYLEARNAFVCGAFLSVILLSQALVENLLGAHLVLDEVSRSIRSQAAFKESEIPKRPSLEWVIKKSREIGLITEPDEKSLRRLRSIRNPLTHFRPVDDPANVDRRALDQRVHTFAVFEEDARFSITTIIQLVSKPEFSVGRRR